MIREVDKDGSGSIDFDEFCATVSRDINPHYPIDEVKSIFQKNSLGFSAFISAFNRGAFTLYGVLICFFRF